MCGIVGVLGNHEVAPLLVEALKRLEYRGYDSAGIATVTGGRLDRRRAVGKLVNLSGLLVHDPLSGKSGIGHTRWATHGAPTVVNAHPHRAGPVAVVHNGIIENFRELRADLAAHGYPVDPIWYEAQAEFRFPFCGEVEVEGTKLELRQALEPWHVLGEPGAIGGTVRYTDSSVERLQVQLTPLYPDRYRVMCNRRPVPLTRTDTAGEAVAGVRFKAWQPPEALHPVLPRSEEHRVGKECRSLRSPSKNKKNCVRESGRVSLHSHAKNTTSRELTHI